MDTRYVNILNKLNESKEVKEPKKVNEYFKLAGLTKGKKLTDSELYKILDKYNAQFLVSPKDDETPTPWDASFSIEGNEFVMDGYLSSNGPSNGTCVVRVPLDKVAKLYNIEIECDNSANEELIAILEEYGIIAKR